MRLAAIVSTVLLGSAGIAQAQPVGSPPQLAEVEDESRMVEAFDMTVDDLESMDVRSAGGETIGDVDDVLVNDQDEISAVSVEVGGFLGVGEKEVVMPLDQLRLEGDVLVAALSREEIERLDPWME